MKVLPKFSLWSMVMRAADDGAGSGDAGAAGEAAKPDAGTAGGDQKQDTTSILYGDDKPVDDKAGAGAADDKAAGDWKEYAPDPAKSDADNAAAKAEHDKTKPADDKDKDDPANKVPEDGKYDLKMPEGVQVDTELVTALGSDFKEFGLTNAQAQKLADKFIAVQQGRAEKQAETWGNTLQQWVTDAKTDKDMGGDKWDATVATSRRAVERLGTPALKEYLNASGGGNHPELIRFMAKVGSMISEDDPAQGNQPGKATRDRAEVLYPDDKPKGN